VAVYEGVIRIAICVSTWQYGASFIIGRYTFRLGTLERCHQQRQCNPKAGRGAFIRARATAGVLFLSGGASWEWNIQVLDFEPDLAHAGDNRLWGQLW